MALEIGKRAALATEEHQMHRRKDGNSSNGCGDGVRLLLEVPPDGSRVDDPANADDTAGTTETPQASLVSVPPDG